MHDPEINLASAARNIAPTDVMHPCVRTLPDPLALRAGRIPHRTTRVRTAFSFTEILFAVIVLGIGFIMVAAIFPVAIQQGKITTDQSSATAVAHGALNYLQQVGANSDSIPDAQGGPLFPATGYAGSTAPYYGFVYSFRDPQVPAATVAIPQGGGLLNAPTSPSTTNNPALSTNASRPSDELWNRLNLSLILPSDPRYAFVALYQRNGDPTDRRTWSPFAQVWFIPVTPRARTVFSSTSDLVAGTGLSTYNLQAKLVKVTIDRDPSANYPSVGYNSAGAKYILSHYVLYLYNTGTNAAAPYQPQYFSENCYIIIANDQSAAQTIDGKNNPDIGRMNGHIYHVGLRRPDLDSPVTPQPYPNTIAYDLAPDGDFVPDAGSDAFFGNQSAAALDANAALTQNDDIFAIGNTNKVPLNGSQIYASAPADAYVVGLDNSGGTGTSSSDQGTSQEITAFSTFVKVN
jgi:hypothetical protein